MTAISSVRPLHECAKTRERILAAHRTWLKVFDGIYYFGTQSPELVHPKVRFVVSEQFPLAVDMIGFCASLKGWSAIINGDILVDSRFPQVEALLVKNGGRCAISKRWQFDGPLRGAKVVDNGLDFFAATQDVWTLAAKEFPEHYRFGHSSWDALMLGAFNCLARRHLFDLTGKRLIFHPKHGERRQTFAINDTVRTRFRDHVSWPSRKL